MSIRSKLRRLGGALGASVLALTTFGVVAGTSALPAGAAAGGPTTYNYSCTRPGSASVSLYNLAISGTATPDPALPSGTPLTVGATVSTSIDATRVNQLLTLLGATTINLTATITFAGTNTSPATSAPVVYAFPTVNLVANTPATFGPMTLPVPGFSSSGPNNSTASFSAPNLGVVLGIVTNGNPLGNTTTNPCDLTNSPGSFASTSLVGPPAPVNQAINVGTGLSQSVTLVCNTSNPGGITAYNLTGPSPTLGTLGSLTGAPVANTVLYTSTGGTGVDSFQFQCSDSLYGPGAVGTVTVNVGTPPVSQPITQDVLAGQLVLSCTNPVPIVTTCGTIALPAITLNGTTQHTTSGAKDLVWVADGRGNLAAGWSLSAVMVSTDHSILGFKNGSGDLALANNHIAAVNLSLDSVGCVVIDGAPVAVATPGAGGTLDVSRGLCSAAATHSGGLFKATGTFNLTIPASTAVGTYSGTVQYLVV